MILKLSNVLRSGARKVVLFFNYQWITFGSDSIIKEDDDTYSYLDNGDGGNNLSISNIQVANFNAAAYITGDFTGLSISSYEGTAIPTKTSDSVIDTTVGHIYSITLSNGYIWYASEGQGANIAFIGDNDFLPATIVDRSESFWDVNTDLAYPILNEKAFNKYLVCESFGGVALLADPDGTNIDPNLVVNGTFDSTDNWLYGQGWTVSNGVASCDGTQLSRSRIEQDIIGLLGGESYMLSFDLIVVAGDITYTELGGERDSDNPCICSQKVIRRFHVPLTNDGKLFIAGSSDFVGTVDNVKVERIIPVIDRTGLYKFKIKTTISDVYFIDGGDITSNSGYMLRIDSTYMALFRIDAGVATLLDTENIILDDYDEFTVDLNVSGIDVAINDLYTLTTSDITYTDFGVLLFDCETDDEIMLLKKDNTYYNLSHFMDYEGDYRVQMVVSVDGLVDIKGNDLIYSPTDGIYDTNYFYQNNDDEGLNYVFDGYSELGFMKYPNKFTYEELKGIDTSGISELDFSIDNSNVAIRDIKINPYESLRDSLNLIIYDSNNEIIEPPKSF